jgi:integrase
MTTVVQTTPQSPESGKEVAKQMSRFSAGYWLPRVYRPTYTHETQPIGVAQFYARMQHAHRREAVPLNTNNREEASRKAAKLYQRIRSNGWDQALKELDPDRYSPRSNLTTIGGYLETCEPLFSGRRVTWAMYAYSLRKIAIEIAAGRITDKKKYDPLRKVWQQKANGVPLSVLTPAALQKWKKGSVALAGPSPVSQLRARRNVNSFMLNARTLFGPKMMKRLANHGLPLPVNPFEGVELEDNGSTKYVSAIRAVDLLKDAKAELGEADPEAWKVILLGLGAGLRRGEIDMLETRQLDERESLIRVVNSDQFEAKTADSQDVVYVDATLIAELRKNVVGHSVFVINPNIAPAQNRAPKYYRCQDTFVRVTTWLRAHGVKAQKPLHVLRKEFGSLVNAASDIHTASRQLRHATIKMTAAVYTDHRRRPESAVPIGTMLATKDDFPNKNKTCINNENENSIKNR